MAKGLTIKASKRQKSLNKEPNEAMEATELVITAKHQKKKKKVEKNACFVCKGSRVKEATGVVFVKCYRRRSPRALLSAVYA